jgi:hypothetical protein
VPGPLVFPCAAIASLAVESMSYPSLPSASIGAPSLALSAHTVPLPPPPPPPTTDWVVDSRASFHTTPTTSSLLHSHPPHPSHPSSIVVGNGSTLPVTSVGASVLPGPFCLNDVLVAPGLTHPLLSVRRFTSDNQCSMEFDPWGLTIRHLPTHVVLARCDSSGPLYSLHLPTTPHTRVASSLALTTTTTSHALATTTTSSAIWHRCLGHPGPDVMSQLAGHSDISYTRAYSEHLCHACQLGRHSGLPFSTSTFRVVQAFDLVHCDLWTSPVLSLSGYKYYLVILDDYSHFLWTSPSAEVRHVHHPHSLLRLGIHPVPAPGSCPAVRQWPRVRQQRLPFILPHSRHPVASLVSLHLCSERPGRGHDSHHHQHDSLPSLSGVSPCHLLGRGPSYRHASPQPSSLEGGEPPYTSLRPIRHNPFL